MTNSIAIALEASSNPNYNVVLVGGAINTRYQFSYGSDAIEQLKNYHAEKLILSVDGVDTKHGFTTYYDKEVTLDRAMIEQSDRCIIAADSSKIHNNAFAKISDLSVADCIVTNVQPDEVFLAELRELGIEII